MQSPFLLNRVVENESFFSLTENELIKLIKIIQGISNKIVITKDNMNTRFELINIIEPAYDAARRITVSGNVMVFSMNV